MDRLEGLPFQQGQHICAVYDTRDEQLAVAAAYLADGLRIGERCLYATDSLPGLADFRSRLRALGVDAGNEERRRALVLLTSEQAHLRDGQFDCERMLRMLNDAVEEALNDGFVGLRTCGDMSWLIDKPPGSHQVVEYEAVLNQFFLNVRGLGMCQYDRRRLPAGLLDHAGLVAHSTIVVDGAHQENPYYDVESDGRAERRHPAAIDETLGKLRHQD
ncbi:MAG TPA: MEDS domain-containing protein [Longimicrobiales bacterium]|nr:MEDS domain-containing protein [Longimicrobiales bacterium]